jgi:hypothetical protein
MTITVKSSYSTDSSPYFTSEQGFSSSLIVHPGTDIVMNAQDTLSATLIGSNSTTNSTSSKDMADVTIDIASGNPALSFSFVNNYLSGSINIYISGQDPNNNNAWVFVLPDGSFYYPSSTTSSSPVPFNQDIAIPLSAQGNTTSVTIPGYLSSGRIYAAVGNLNFEVETGGGLVVPSANNPDDPSVDINWGFSEFTNTNDGIFADVSYIDVVGIPIGISLTGSSGTQTVLGITSNTVSSVCSALTAQAAIDGQPWGGLCFMDTDGTPLRVIAPSDYISIEGSAFENYFTSYVEKVWDYYTNHVLTIDTQQSYGEVACQVVGTNLTCDGGDSWSYAQPNANDIFGCNSGPFENAGNGLHLAIVARLCAAFNRGTLLLTGGNIQPSLSPSSYYTAEVPLNYFSKFVHENEIDNMGYAFPYDDVAPNGAQAVSGAITDAHPTSFTMVIGGPTD